RSRRHGRAQAGQRRRGGHPGSSRPLVPPDQVDQIQDIYPPGCRRCGQPVQPLGDVEPKRHQVVEIPKVKPQVVEYRLHRGYCEKCEMSLSPQVKNWLSARDMAAWVRAAPDKETYQHRLAISLLVCEQCHVTVVARMLHVGVRSIWRWIQQYNAEGPQAVEGCLRGGRRDGYLSPE